MEAAQLTPTTVYSGALDIILSILPWKIVWKVAINKKEKIGALIAMSFGVLCGSTQPKPLLPLF